MELSQKRAPRGFTLLEVMLSIIILSIIIYSLFIVFDRSISAMEGMFSRSYRFEKVKSFFETIRKELKSSVADQNEEVFHFRGGPHWIEFGSPILKDVNILDFIKKGLNELEAENKKIHYFGANIPDENGIPVTHVFRMIPLHESHLELMLRPKSNINLDSPAGTIENYEIPDDSLDAAVNTWIESDPNAVKLLTKTNKFNISYLSSVFSVRRVLVCRSLRFRYFYSYPFYEDTTHKEDEEPTIKESSHDWWDSKIRFPTLSEDPATNYQRFITETILLSPLLDAIDIERDRRYKSNPNDFAFHYENEPPHFRPFGDNILALKPYFDASQNQLDWGIELLEDPWFNRSPAFIEVSIILYDAEAPEGKGDRFNMQVVLPAHREAISNYYSSLLNE
jgi:prepilin-type N-terminal cleavage/methylation domain-containing protein